MLIDPLPKLLEEEGVGVVGVKEGKRADAPSFLLIPSCHLVIIAPVTLDLKTLDPEGRAWGRASSAPISTLTFSWDQGSPGFSTEAIKQPISPTPSSLDLLCASWKESKPLHQSPGVLEVFIGVRPSEWGGDSCQGERV